MPRLARIVVYPIKSFDGVALDEAQFAGVGGFRHDRRFALQAIDGHFVNGKRYAAIHRIRAAFDLAAGIVTLAAPQRPTATFELRPGNTDLEVWCGDYFGFPVTFVENVDTGFPDDLDSPGPTLISTPTLRRIAEWFRPLTLDDVRRRFRANLEIDGDAAENDAADCPPFWEDRLYSPLAAQGSRTTVTFRIGAARLEGVNPCARCVVPTRDPESGEARARFVAEFTSHRRTELPDWAPPGAFDHFYRLAVNTRAPAALGATIRVGDEVALVESVKL